MKPSSSASDSTSGASQPSVLGWSVAALLTWGAGVDTIPAAAEPYGPISPRPDRAVSTRLIEPSVRWGTRLPPDQTLRSAYDTKALSRPWSDEPDKVETIERVSGEEQGPRIPEPMVFDLVRPLGAKRGETEANALGLIPLGRKTRQVNGAPDPLGLVRRSPDRQGIEWAPEIEYTIRDGLALEFELPMENGHLEAYKMAGQVTFGTAFEHHFIHGAQTIVQYDLDPKLWTATWLYLAGYRFDKTWSLFGMIGPRHEIGSVPGGRKVEMLSNVTLFADVTERVVAGIETNFGQVLGGSASLLVMPQLHYELGKFWMLQAGVGARYTSGFTLPEIGFRLIREF